MGFRVKGFGFKVKVFFGFGVKGFWALGLGLRVWGLGLRVLE